MNGSVFVALLAGHLLGDWVIQTDYQAHHKTESWRAMAGHIATYHWFMALILLPVLWHPSALAVLAVSAATHAFIDRRWPVRALLRATGSPVFAESTWGVLAADQALHVAVLAVCALAVG